MNTREYNIIVRQWAPHLLRFANRNMNNMDIAKDLVQDAFEVLWNKKDEVQAEKAKQFLFTVVYRKGIDMFRKEGKITDIQESHLEISHGGRSFEATYSDKELLAKAIAELPAQHRQLIMLRDLEGYDYREIEKITSLSESQVKVYLFRARKMLKEAIIRIEAL